MENEIVELLESINLKLFFIFAIIFVFGIQNFIDNLKK